MRRPAGSIFSSATSLDSSLPTSFAGAVLPVAKRTVRRSAPFTTWAFVTISPARDTKKPEPVAVPPPVCPNGPAVGVWRAMICTTDAPARR